MVCCSAWAPRNRHGASRGDKIVFVENQEGDIVLVRPSVAALLEAQRVFRGAAEEAGFRSEEELDAYVAEVRKERGRRKHG